MELGLLANMILLDAQESLRMAQSIGASFSGEAIADLAEQAGVSEREVNRIRMESNKSKMQTDQGPGQWQ